MFVFDTETRTDHTQRLTFGSYRFIVAGQCLKEALFSADDLSATERRALTRYIDNEKHRANVSPEGLFELLLLNRFELVKELYRDAYKARCLLIAFNFPFDVSRIAHDSTYARGRFAGGFSLGLWSYLDKTDAEKRNSYRPRIAIKHIDSKRALKGFTGRQTPDGSDLIPEGSITGTPEKDYIFRGHFLDLRTLAFALTDRGYTLKQACEAFGVEHGKTRAKRHGIITKTYIDYNRRDVLATSELAEKLLEEYMKHPITLQPTKAYSPASIGKAYLRTMGIRPILERQSDFPMKYLGYAQSAFFGGRISAHIRKVPVPVVYTDFLSMYPTVNSLMFLWSFVTAQEIKVVEYCKSEAESFLQRLKDDPDILFKPETWKDLTAFVRVLPNGDILPSRARYSSQTNDWQVAVNYLYAKGNDASQALWFSLPDVVASVVLTGHIPKIVDGFRIRAEGKLKELRPVKLRSAVEVDPAQRNFFKVVIEERKRLATRTDLSKIEHERLDKALKVLANATSYGIYAEMNRLESDRKTTVKCHGRDATPFTCRVAHPDEPGAYCFPPLASLITGAARLMLALLEHGVTKLGGTYAMEDTDSMAIVSTEYGSTIPCERDSVRALSWKQVDELSDRFSALNPYDRNAVPGSILKIEEDNFDPKTRKRRQIYCFAISAKRYALFLRDDKNAPALLRKGSNNKEDRWSEHGLGHLLNPTDPENEDREWIAQVWLAMIRKALKLPTENLLFASLPAVGRVTVSSPAVMKPLAKLNQGKKYGDQIKPFNFLLTCHVKPLGHPPGVDPEQFHLISPYESDSQLWLQKMWIDQYSETAKEYRITTAGFHGNRNTARVKTYGEVVLEYEFHPESKCADMDCKFCSKHTVGLLQRRHIQIDQIKYIGKESNSLEEVDSGLIHSAQNVYTEYPDPRRDEWQTTTLPAVKKMRLSELVTKTGMSRSALKEIRAGRSRPHRRNQELLATMLGELDIV